MNVSQLVFIISLLCLMSCTEESILSTNAEDEELVPDNIQDFGDVDQRLLSYFQSFEEEAALRGIDINITDFGTTGEISDIPENGVAGTCEYGAHINHVTVDLNYWNNTSELEREFVVFHELGHCVLHLDHNDTSFSNGLCVSLMASGTGGCRNAYNNQNREYYIDELFGVGN